MREILFRGRQEDNGEWVYGRLLADDVIVPKGQEFYTPHNILDSALHAYTVLTETVGQYTNLVDKNGSKIFEGDILRVTYPDGNNITEATGSVKFLNGCYIIDSTVFYNYRLDEFFSLEKIGNIYDKF